MSTDRFEDTLRDLLRDTADAEGSAYLDVDPGAVLGHGRRVVRRRRLASGLGVAAATVAVGLVGLSALDAGADRTSTPAGSPRGGSWSRTIAVDLSLTGPEDNGITTVQVGVDRAQDNWTHSVVRPEDVTTSGSSRKTAVTLETHALPVSRAASGWAMVPGSPGLAVGVVPSAATDVVPLWLHEPMDPNRTLAALPGTAYRAFAAWPGGGASTQLIGLDWTDGEQVFDSTGRPIPSGRSGESVVFFDPRHGVLGILADRALTTKHVSDIPPEQLPTLTVGRIPGGSDTAQTTVLVLLPAGAQGVDARPRHGATVEEVLTVPGGDTAHTMVALRVSVPTATGGTGVDRISWTNPGGRTGSSALGD